MKKRRRRKEAVVADEEKCRESGTGIQRKNDSHPRAQGGLQRR